MRIGRRAKVCCLRLTLCATNQRSGSRLDSAPADTALSEIYKKPAASWSPSFSHSPQGNRHRNQVPDTCARTPAEPASLPGWAQLSPFTNPVFLSGHHGSHRSLVAQVGGAAVWFGQGPDGASRASTKPSDSHCPQDQIIGIAAGLYQILGTARRKSQGIGSATDMTESDPVLGPNAWRG